MNSRRSLTVGVWIFCVLFAMGFVGWGVSTRAAHARQVTSLGNDDVASNSESATGYAAGVRRLIIPGHNEASYRWIEQTQEMLAHQEWRIRHVDNANAPIGHAVSASSPYRWWLGSLASLHHTISGTPMGASVEWAALWADPVLQLIFLLGVALLVARVFGLWPSIAAALAIALLYPWATAFLPGFPNVEGIAVVTGLSSILCFIAGASASFRGEQIPSRDAQGWFVVAAVAGALGLWFSVSVEAPLLFGLGLGGMLAECVRRSANRNTKPIIPWKIWSVAGAAGTLVAYLAEFFPNHLGGWELRAIHPLYALAWLGAGLCLDFASRWIAGGKLPRRLSPLIWLVLGLGALASLPVTLWKTHQLGFLAPEITASQLTKIPGTAIAENAWAWLVHDGLRLEFVAAFSPVILVALAIVLIGSRKFSEKSRIGLALAAGPALVALGFAVARLNAATWFDAAVIAMIVMLFTALSEPAPRWFKFILGLTAIVYVIGGSAYIPLTGGRAHGAIDPAEARELIERDLAHWLVKQTGMPDLLVYAPANDTAALIYYGGVRGLGTLDPDNRDGFIPAIRIASATSGQEAQELVTRRGVTHFIIPSWDSQLDDFARMGLGNVQNSFMSTLDQWALPPWLRPLAYQLPAISQQQGENVAIFAVVDDQDDAVLAARLAEYFIDINRPDLAANQVPSLRKFPGNAGALAALLNVQLTVGDQAGAEQTERSLATRLSTGADRNLPWDRRVSLASVLARIKRLDLAQPQARRCFAEITEPKLRLLSPAALYHLHILGKGFGLTIQDPKLRQLALDLLPPESRARLLQ